MDNQIYVDGPEDGTWRHLVRRGPLEVIIWEIPGMGWAAEIRVHGGPAPAPRVELSSVLAPVPKTIWQVVGQDSFESAKGAARAEVKDWARQFDGLAESMDMFGRML